jgi:hypothetical protein
MATCSLCAAAHETELSSGHLARLLHMHINTVQVILEVSKNRHQKVALAIDNITITNGLCSAPATENVFYGECVGERP